MWPGLVGKGDGEGQEPILRLRQMIEFTPPGFDGIDLALWDPDLNVRTSDDEIRRLADFIDSKDLSVGSLVAPVWSGTVGDTSMGNDDQQERFLRAIQVACRIAKVLKTHGVRKYGCIRIDSAEFGVAKWRKDPKTSTARIIETFKKAAKIATDHDERLAAEGEICWAGMHSWRDMLDVLEGVGMPEALGFQADLAHTYLYTLGYNAPEHALVKEGYSETEFYDAYEKMTNALRPWTLDFHVAQNDGTVHGAGSHDKTGKHCQADDPNGKLDIVKCAGYWLKDAAARGIQHICWDGCMFPNSVLETPATWDTVLKTMVEVRNTHGWD
jgi:sugar phosphate isomerase/epimerase